MDDWDNVGVDDLDEAGTAQAVAALAETVCRLKELAGYLADLAGYPIEDQPMVQ